jgi:predicted kinase
MEIARRVLRELECDVAIREEIAALVRYHGRPPYILEKENPEREVIGLSWLANNRLLYLFALADTRGRHAQETSRPEENLHLWKLVAEERNCFDAPYVFANAQARFLFFREQLSSLHYTPHEDYRCTVTLMSGLPGAGKDTWLAQRRPGLPVVALDAIRELLDVEATDNQGEVIQTAREKCREHLRAGRNFAFNATNTTRQTRQRWVELFADYHARIEIVYLEPPLANHSGAEQGSFGACSRKGHPASFATAGASNTCRVPRLAPDEAGDGTTSRSFPGYSVSTGVLHCPAGHFSWSPETARISPLTRSRAWISSAPLLLWQN